ncbi:hypothetical protein BKA04_000684 [Cryobacterium mesophilum]|uniref:Uncharacterized protein n=1 Tax=Terrimesophilobacter mesophilus TaxID=433647 RepID=A0A4R8VB15_9MICO|nr:hypothetical protein [Terrimesophilobacter mesophilus]MBB5632461.1 hypothetical protein [Terrimesophilobacter mesophilus]TFB79290.1 hypothetical protein E3N84_04010 [Terrimesophilobacter mesophilus]
MRRPVILGIRRGGRASAAGTFVGVAFVTALVLGGVVAPASAVTGIEVSRDGMTFTGALPGTLFDQITVSVPGDTQSTVLYVRNAGSTAGFLRVALTSVTVSDPALAEALTVSAATADFPGAPVALAEAEPCHVLTEGDLVAPGGVVRISSALRFGDLQGTIGQNGSATFSFRVSLSDAVVGSLLPTECGSGTTIPAAGDDSIPLAHTGAEPPAAMIMGTAVMLGVGLFLLVTARRRREAKE